MCCTIASASCSAMLYKYMNMNVIREGLYHHI